MRTTTAIRALLVLAILAGAVLTAPLAAASDAGPRVWVYSGTQNFRHGSIPHSKTVIADLANKHGFTAEFTEDPADLTAEMLERTDVVLFLSPSGIRQPDNSEKAPFTEEQRALFIEWIGCGGGFVGVHQAADSYDDWPEWNELVGARFEVHPNRSIIDQLLGNEQPEAELKIVDQQHTTTAPWHGQATLKLRDEYYLWRNGDTPDRLTTDYNPLIHMGPYSDPLVANQWNSRFGDKSPLAWTSTFRGQNRSFYTNLGHSSLTWNRADYQTHLVNGIRWTAEGARTC
jgi:uncharacterized protein